MEVHRVHRRGLLSTLRLKPSLSQLANASLPASESGRRRQGEEKNGVAPLETFHANIPDQKSTCGNGRRQVHAWMCPQGGPVACPQALHPRPHRRPYLRRSLHQAQEALGRPRVQEIISEASRSPEASRGSQLQNTVSNVGCGALIAALSGSVLRLSHYLHIQMSRPQASQTPTS